MYDLHKKRNSSKRVILTLGLPGSGKTTVSDFIEKISGGIRVRLPKIVSHFYTEEEIRYNAQNAILFSGKELYFLEYIDALSFSTIIIDGFLRSDERLEILHEYAKKTNWKVEILYLHLGDATEAIELSRLRQLFRGSINDLSTDRIEKKINRDSSSLLTVLHKSNKLNYTTHWIDARKDIETVFKHVRISLSLDPYSLEWDLGMLQKLYTVAPDAWVVGGGNTYKPFFNNRFGPPSLSWDIDLSVVGKDRSIEVKDKLYSYFPEYNWDVKDIVSWSEKELGYSLKAVEDSIPKMALICTCIGLQWTENGLNIVFGHNQTEPNLWNGVLIPNETGHIKFANDKIKKILSFYPATYCPSLDNYIFPIKNSYVDIMNPQNLGEFGGRSQQLEWTEKEEDIIKKYISIRESIDKKSQAVPLPFEGKFPEGDPWTASDLEFRFWVYNQFRSRNPFNGKDKYIHNAISVQSGTSQKPTHQGWELPLHVLHTLLELETDNLIDYRKELRVAMLWHDLGKIWNNSTPGAHQFIGAKKWLLMQKNHSLGLSNNQTNLITEIIKYHDIFGRLERSIWDENYNGKISVSYVRECLSNNLVSFIDMVKITKASWKADVGGTPLLRWLKPLSDIIESLIILKQ